MRAPESGQHALDPLLPSYDYGEVHQRLVAADPVVCDRAFRELRADEVRLLGPLLGLRALPKRLRGRGRRVGAGQTTRPLIDAFIASGFTVLADEEGRQLAAGAIGRWWSPTGNEPVAGIPDAEAFLSFDAPGYAKAAVAFEFTPAGPGTDPARPATMIRTETRIAATDATARRLFGAYWALIRLPSGLVRRSWLAAIERRALSIGA